MGQFLDYAAENVPNDGDVIVILDGDSGVTKYMTRANFWKDPAFEDGAITEVMLAPKQVQTVTSATTVTPEDGARMVKILAQATALTIANPAETFTTERQIVFKIKDNGTARTISWGNMYRGIGVTLPTTTTAGKLMIVAGMYDVEDNKINILSVGREA